MHGVGLAVVWLLSAPMPNRRQALTAVWEGVLICWHAYHVYDVVRTRSAASSWTLYHRRAWNVDDAALAGAGLPKQ